MRFFPYSETLLFYWLLFEPLRILLYNCHKAGIVQALHPLIPPSYFWEEKSTPSCISTLNIDFQLLCSFHFVTHYREMKKDSKSVAKRGPHGARTFAKCRSHVSDPSVYFHRAHILLWILLDTLILEVFCGLEEDGGAVILTRCNLIASLAFNNMLGNFCLFKLSSFPENHQAGGLYQHLWPGRQVKWTSAGHQLLSPK